MARATATGLAVPSDAPWYLTATIVCPRCGTPFTLSAEDFVPTAGPFGAADTIWHWWRQLVEGDPATAALDLSNHHLDPAQVRGPCPVCYYPVAARGPRYGLTKILDLPADPAPGAIAGYLAAGAVKMLWYDIYLDPTASGGLLGLFARADNGVVGLDAATGWATGVIRSAATLDYVPDFPFCLAQPNESIPPSAARGRDPALCSWLAGYGLIV
jgi:hypothetical protein